MVVVRTVLQLEKAVREKARKMTIVGALAPEIWEILTQPVSKKSVASDVSKLREMFSVSKVDSESGSGIAVLCERK